MKRVAFHGFVPSSLPDLEDYLRRYKDAELWGFNGSDRLVDKSNKHRSRYTRWYELHSREKFEADGDVDNMAQADCRVILQQPHPGVPSSEAFPIEEVKALLIYPYITNSITMMIVHAILDGFEEIALFGIDMAIRMGDGPSELSEQRPSVEYALGIAVGRGLSVVIPDACDLLKTDVIYGYDEHQDSIQTWARRHLQYLQDQRRSYERAASQYQGAIDEFTSTRARWGKDI